MYPIPLLTLKQERHRIHKTLCHLSPRVFFGTSWGIKPRGENLANPGSRGQRPRLWWVVVLHVDNISPATVLCLTFSLLLLKSSAQYATTPWRLPLDAVMLSSILHSWRNSRSTLTAGTFNISMDYDTTTCSAHGPTCTVGLTDRRTDGRMDRPLRVHN